jgi:hypothetical protein
MMDRSHAPPMVDVNREFAGEIQLFTLMLVSIARALLQQSAPCGGIPYAQSPRA